MGNPAHDIHNRAIKSGTEGSMTFTLAYTLTKARTERSRLQLRSEANYGGLLQR